MRYLACDETKLTETGECLAEVWVQVPSWSDALPTVEEAQTVGAAFFVSLLILAAMKRLLKPQREME